MEKFNETVHFLRSQIGDFSPEVGIILGTGLGKLAEEINVSFIINYDQIPNFPVSTVESHSGKLIFGEYRGKKVVCMQGRFHFYEGYSMKQVTFPIQIMKLLGIKYLFISNASGGLNPAFKEGDLMVIHDHISLFLPENPLTGKCLFGERFPDMSEPYDFKLISEAKLIASEYGINTLHEGVYVSVTGPNLETRAEYKMLRLLGADAVGMSTVPEVIVARQLEIQVFGISVITDLCIPETLKKAKLENILANAAKAEPDLSLIISELIARL